MSVSEGWQWPVELREGPITLRPMHRRDSRRWRSVRAVNADWLAPWEATNPDPTGVAPTFGQMIRSFNREARAGRMLPFAVDLDGLLVGQVTVSGLAGGSLRSGQIGYWVDRRVAGRGITPAAVAMATDHCFFGLGMHRMEVNIRPENRASLRVVEKLGFRPEGLRRRYLHIDGAWRDHLTFALTTEDVPGGLLPRWRALAADLADERAERAGRAGQVTGESAVSEPARREADPGSARWDADPGSARRSGDGASRPRDLGPAGPSAEQPAT